MSYLVSKSQYLKIPDVLFYKRKINKLVNPKQIEYVAFSTKDSKKRGELIIHKSAIQHREDYLGPTLAIDFIKANEKNCGLGTEMINFAKNYSKQIGCNGYIVLRADSSFTPERVPHIFYRKQGFSTLNKETDAKMDKFIKYKSNATIKDFVVNIMHYPPKQDKPRFSFLEKIKKILKRLHL